ncbi:MAG: hypothetical protein A2Y84_00875 [Candidatus Colwellbacteria bacterium RBG_13_48_8]|uniref:R3H domain-containing protein n=1 Tax=Candidatus Colwellbacteria bacterium RBG_13_48_8 TaxID=1797685 RepID=A0A1G1YV11_9BACT|nr:MAG: hypothetical protein A2Y84_00875 [Candidatus Colwellbacteria bacterium RBG_13_48_8]
MKETGIKIRKLLELIGFDNVRVESDNEEDKISVFIKDHSVAPARLPELVLSLTHLAKQIAKKSGDDRISVDINDYHKEREVLITRLAKAAAKKAAVTGESVSLPAMNAYERRIVHTELAIRPDVETESEGEMRERHVVIKPTKFTD